MRGRGAGRDGAQCGDRCPLQKVSPFLLSEELDEVGYRRGTGEYQEVRRRVEHRLQRTRLDRREDILVTVRNINPCARCFQLAREQIASFLGAREKNALAREIVNAAMII